jgi:regulator of cell morphogenesis and NO signaling
MTTIDPQGSLAAMVSAHPETAQVFQRHRLDFCCRGETSLAEACAQKKIDLATLSAELVEVIESRSSAQHAEDLACLATPELVKEIVDRHHAYLREVMPFLEMLAIKVARVHGDSEPRLLQLRDAYLRLKEALEPHLDQEERVLFPTLLQGEPDKAVLASEFSSMHHEHLAVGDLLQEIRALADDFRAPGWACRSYQTLFAELEALEGDTLRHVHTENHVLMPRFQGTVVAAQRLS